MKLRNGVLSTGSSLSASPNTPLVAKAEVAAVCVWEQTHTQHYLTDLE